MANLEDTQQEIIDLLESLSGFTWHEQAIPDGQSVKKVNGEITPYFAYQFGDIIAEGATNFGNVLLDDYQQPFYVQAIAGDATTARKMAAHVTQKTLGARFEHGGVIRKRPGGAPFPITASNGATEAYAHAISFTLLVDLAPIE